MYSGKDITLALFLCFFSSESCIIVFIKESPQLGTEQYFLQIFRTAKILKYHVNECFKIDEKQMIKMHEKVEYVRFKICKRELNHCL